MVNKRHDLNSLKPNQTRLLYRAGFPEVSWCFGGEFGMTMLDIRANGIGQPFYVDLEAEIPPEWILQKNGTRRMELNGGFATLGPKGMYAERTISSEDTTDLSELY